MKNGKAMIVYLVFVKWKGYDSLFNSCIDKKDIM